MPRPLRLVLGLLLLFALGACGRQDAPEEGTPPDLAPAESLLRCAAEPESDAAYRQASRALLEAARTDPALLGSGDLVVAYRTEGGPGAALRARPEAAARAVRAEQGLTLRRSLAGARELVAARDPLAAAERLLDDPRVRYAHPNLAIVPQSVPDDPGYAEQWHLDGFGLPAAWDRSRGSADVVVAVVDDGVDVAHPEFAGRIEPGWDFAEDDADVSTPSDHGTHVAGIAAATGGNGVGVSGLAREGVRILPVKVFDDYGQGEVAAVADAVRWAAGLDVRAADGSGPAPRDEPVRIVNLSLGTAGGYVRVPELDAAIRDARRQGVLVIASAGNEGTRTGVTAPANGPCAVAVGSVDEDLDRSSFSNHDAETRRIDLAAPGGVSLAGDAILSTLGDGGYGRSAGTSMAAPFVSGAAALLWSVHPGWTGEEVLERLLASAWLPVEADERELGFGIVCADAALGAATRCGR